MANECISYYEPGRDVTGHCTAAVTGKRFLKISGNRSTDGNIAVATADAAGQVFGVAGFDAAIGKKVTVVRGRSRVVPVTLGANVAAFQEVEVGAAGVAVVKASGVAVGRAVTAGTNGQDGQIELY